MLELLSKILAAHFVLEWLSHLDWTSASGAFKFIPIKVVKLLLVTERAIFLLHKAINSLLLSHMIKHTL